MLASQDIAARPGRTILRAGFIYDLGAVFIIIASLLLHIYLVANGYPQTNSDESTMGLMARHILYQGKPVFLFYGQDYMGSLEAYLGACFFVFFGPSVFALRMGVILEFMLFLICLYVLSSLLSSRKIGLISLLIACAGPSELLFSHVVAAGGPMEVLLFGSLLALIAVFLVVSYQQNTLSRRMRVLLYAVWGLLAGLALWSDPLVLPFVALPALLLLLFCWREIRGALFWLVLLCALIGFSPYLLFWFTVPADQVQSHLISLPSQAKPTPVHTALSSPQPPSQPAPSQSASLHTTEPQWVGDYGQPVPAPSPSQRVLGMLVIALPLATGASQLCAISSHEAWPLTAQSSTHLIQCSIVHGLWSLAHIIFWGIAVWLALHAFRFFWRTGMADPEPTTIGHYQLALLHACRLMVLGAAGLSLLLYTISQTPAIVPWSTSRYLVGLHIATPIVVWGLWAWTARPKTHLFMYRALQVVRYGLLFVLLGVLFWGTWVTLDNLPAIRLDEARDSVLIARLEQLHVRTFYSDYWTCNRLIFQSEERLTCSVLDEKLQPGLDRYLPYRAIVHQDPHAAYLFQSGSAQLRAFAKQSASSTIHYSHQVIEGYVIYQSANSG